MSYLTWKALHLIAMVAWFAAIFYLPRLFVYHAIAQRENDDQSMRRFCVMERKLYILGHIAMGMTYLFGGLLLWSGGWHFLAGQGWLHVKLTLVVMLTLYYVYCGYLKKSFAAGKNQYSERFYRWFNEIPTVLLILIILLATLKPF